MPDPIVILPVRAARPLEVPAAKSPLLVHRANVDRSVVAADDELAGTTVRPTTAAMARGRVRRIAPW